MRKAGKRAETTLRWIFRPQFAMLVFSTTFTCMKKVFFLTLFFSLHFTANASKTESSSGDDPVFYILCALIILAFMCNGVLIYPFVKKRSLLPRNILRVFNAISFTVILGYYLYNPELMDLLYLIALLLLTGIPLALTFILKGQDKDDIPEEGPDTSLLLKQTLTWMFFSSVLLYFLIDPASQSKKMKEEQKRKEELRAKQLYDEMAMLLNIYYAEVRPIDSQKRFLVGTKNGQHFEAWIDSKADNYVFSFSVFKELPVADTTAWLERLTLIEPMLNAEQIRELRSTLDKKNFQVKQTDKVNYYNIPFTKGELMLSHYFRDKRMQISFSR